MDKVKMEIETQAPCFVSCKDYEGFEIVEKDYVRMGGLIFKVKKLKYPTFFSEVKDEHILLNKEKGK
jgi:hypothetical protein